MTSNKLKIIACISMLIDHVGFLLFPKIQIFRYIGRIALPIFAYFIAEGCLHTRSRRKYFFSVLSLAVLCQLVYLAEDMLDGKVQSINLNILFTFALSILLCTAYLNMVNSRACPIPQSIAAVILFVCTLIISVFLCIFLNSISPIGTYFDYGIAGVVLPVFALISPRKKHRLILFCGGMVIFNIIISANLWYSWFSLLSIPLLLMYNGKRGSQRLKYFFYLFYPAHFALIYIIKLIAF